MENFKPMKAIILAVIFGVGWVCFMGLVFGSPSKKLWVNNSSVDGSTIGSSTSVATFYFPGTSEHLYHCNHGHSFVGSPTSITISWTEGGSFRLEGINVCPYCYLAAADMFRVTDDGPVDAGVVPSLITP